MKIIAEHVFNKWKNVSLYGCSLGAFFSLNAYKNIKFSNSLFQSPIVDMQYLIGQMFKWFNITKEQLEIKKEIETPVDPLRWDYYQYVTNNPITKWDSRTEILYGGKDNMQSYDVINTFAQTFKCQLTISENSEHPFMKENDLPIVTKWLKDNI